MSTNYADSTTASAERRERKSLETRLLQAQKMESVGLMAGSTAHDVNNILHVISGFGSLTMSKMREDDPLRDNLSRIVAAACRASDLTANLLNFSRETPVVQRRIDLRDILGNVRSFLAMLMGEEIRLKMTCPAEPLQVRADGAQFEQVVINLAANARHAMPEGGTLSIVAEAVRVDREFISLHGSRKPGDYALVSVTDDGTGMDRYTAGRVFEPYFTTKTPREGTGLGLSIAYRIVREHNGFIDVGSEPGKGTTFRIYLPLEVPGENPDENALPAGSASGDACDAAGRP